MSDLIDRYLACWNENDGPTRRRLLEEVFTDDASYTDPMADVRGRAALDATIAAVHDQFPGFVFTPAAPLDQHHRQARFGWGLGPVGSTPIIEGFDVVVLGEDGRIETVLGFLDKVPT